MVFVDVTPGIVMCVSTLDVLIFPCQKDVALQFVFCVILRMRSPHEQHILCENSDTSGGYCGRSYRAKNAKTSSEIILQPRTTSSAGAATSFGGAATSFGGATTTFGGVATSFGGAATSFGVAATSLGDVATSLGGDSKF